MSSLTHIQKDIAALPPDAQQIIFDLVDVLKKRYLSAEITQQESTDISQDWSDFIGSVDAEADLSRNYKIYLAEGLNAKYNHH